MNKQTTTTGSTFSDDANVEQTNAFEEVLEKVNGSTETADSTEKTDVVDEGHTTKLATKTHAILFWIIFFLIIVLITIKGVLELTEVMKLQGAFQEKQYTTADIKELTTNLEEMLSDENATMHTAYGLDMKLQPGYQVYAAEDGTCALVLYSVQFNNNTYTISAETSTNYYVGLNTLFKTRNDVIASGKYSWDNSYIPEDPIITPTPVPEYTGGLEDTPVEEIERGGGEEDY